MAACGAYVTTAVSQDGDLWTMGKGDDGALGANTSESHLQPLCMGHVSFFGGLRVVMSSAASCKSGAVGQFHAAALTEGAGRKACPWPKRHQNASLSGIPCLVCL